MNGLVYVNSYMRHARRGTWQHPATGVWYELDGFLVRKEERHGLVKRMMTLRKEDMSDHEPKCVTVRGVRKRWRTDSWRNDGWTEECQEEEVDCDEMHEIQNPGERKTFGKRQQHENGAKIQE